MFNIAVCDDEKFFCDSAADMCGDIMAQLNVPFRILSFQSGSELLSSGKSFDIILLDIDMPGADGFETARGLDSDSLVIFLTGHTEKMREAFTVRAYRFLDKPVDRGELTEALTGAVGYISSCAKILVDDKDKNEEYLIKASDIVYIESLRNTCAVHTAQRYYLSVKTMRYYTSALKSDCFFRIHKSYIVSFAHVIKFESTYVTTDTDRKLEISRRLSKPFLQAFHRYVSRTAIGK